MNDETKFHMKLKISGIGPLRIEEPFPFDINNCKIAIYAPNGSGKTFISRCFALINNQESVTYDKSQLVNFSKDRGSYNFSYRYKNEKLVDINYTINNNGEIQTTSNESNLIFYVFNSDYVQKNFYEKNYQPDGNIPGTITVGEENVEIQQKQDQLKKLNQENQIYEKKLQQTITNKRKEIIQKFNIGSTLAELEFLNEEELLHSENNTSDTSDTLEGFLKKYTELKHLEANPDQYPSLQPLSSYLEHLTYDQEFQELLTTKYTKKNIQSKFLARINRNQTFIKTGLQLKQGANECPFCGQSLDNVQDLIQAYQDFFDETQHKVEQQIDKKKAELDKLYNAILELQTYFPMRLDQFNNQKLLFSETRELNIPNFALPASFKDSYNWILNELNKKAADITESMDLHIQYEQLNSTIQNIFDSIEELNDGIGKLEKCKERAKEEIRSLRRTVCKVTFSSLLSENKELLGTIKQNRKIQQELQEEIDKCMSHRPKKEIVYDKFSRYINKFFGQKYTINKDDFSISLDQYKLKNPALSLSEGEKTVIAFCYYLANVGSVIQNQTDYSRLFFVIDDPISSLDYNFVYITASLIKNLERELNVETKIPMIILTHHADFMNLICSNNITKNAYIIKDHRIKKLSDKFIMPYLQHLYDIYLVAKGKESANHTTPNSIRHVLEHINSFKNSTQSLDEFIKSENIFGENEYVTLLINNLSHGRYKTNPELEVEQILQSCQDLILYIETNFPGQIKQFEN